jgi:dCMP deaminase
LGKFNGYQDISGSTWADLIYSAKRRNIKFDLKIEDVWDLYLKQDKKCALSGIEIFFYKEKKKRNTASIDRKDSKLDYTLDNIQILHKDVNNMKGSLTQKGCINLCSKIFLNDLHKNRPSWEIYFMLLADLVSTRSKDPNTHCGCVITDQNYRIISTGYNGAFQNINDNLVPLTRPEKYSYMVHSEQNALIFAKQDLNNCYAFITGYPCETCTKLLLQAGVSRIYYGTRLAKMCENTCETIEKLCSLKQVPLIQIDVEHELYLR